MRPLSLLLFSLLATISALKCYQGTFNPSAKPTEPPLDCPTQSLSCMEVYDNTTRLITRSCQRTMCIINDGKNTVSSKELCQNTKCYLKQTYCCCYGDGCNLGNFNQTSSGFILFDTLGF